MRQFHWVLPIERGMLLWGKYSFQVLVIMRVSAVMLGPFSFYRLVIASRVKMASRPWVIMRSRMLRSGLKPPVVAHI